MYGYTGYSWSECGTEMYGYTGYSWSECGTEMYGYTGYSWSYWNGNEKLKEKSVSYTGKTFHRFTTADSCTWIITHNTGSTAVWNLKCEWWGAAVVQGKYQEEKVCDRRQQS
jgi:hypothetical protein